jgi:hypothetical protein
MLKLKKILIENSGPISHFEANFYATAEGAPKPTILVGENGSGKTTAISFIVDSLLQLAATKFDDVLTSSGIGTLYYRLRSHDIRIGASSSVAHIQYECDGKNIDYVDRVGLDTDLNLLRQKLGLPADFPLQVEQKHEKSLTANIDFIGPALNSGAYAFFPSGRREIPHWLQERALNPERFTQARKFGNKISRSLIVETAAEETATWIMDGLLDNAVGYKDSAIIVANQLLKVILENPTAHFAIAPRHVWPRVQIFSGAGQEDDSNSDPRRLIIPSLGHLSAGQSMLLSMFGSIANHGTLTANRPLSEIDGIIVIDEAEVYLHTHLQRSVLPQLIKLFPKVQFVISTHSPSFLMGMKDEFGVDGFNILEMPTGREIDVDQFSEIGTAVDTLRQTSAFKYHVREEIARENERPMLIVEGRSDAILIEGLWRLAKNEVPPFRILTAKGRRALRYLLEDEEFVSEVGANQRVLGIFDFDEAFDDWKGCQGYPAREGDEAVGLLKKHERKNIYAGLLPVPANRSRQAGERFGANSSFTIELYLPDNYLSDNQNLQIVTYPGDVQIFRFKGDKVQFAERVAGKSELLPNFNSLIEMIARVLEI